MLFSFEVAAQSSHVTISNPIVATVGLAFVQVLPQNFSRNYIIIFNGGAANVCMGFGVYATATNCIPIPPGGNYEAYHVPIDALFMNSSMAGQSVTIWEGQ